MHKFKCNECGFSTNLNVASSFNYCPTCAILAPHWQSACSGLLGLANIDKELLPAIKAFRKNEYLNAARTATILLESKLRELGETDLYGVALVKHTLDFDFDNKSNTMNRPPKVQINELKTNVQRNEQKGFVSLVTGIFGGLRNVIIHDQIPLNPIHGMAIVLTCDIAFNVLNNGSLKNERVCVWTKVKSKDG